MKKWGSFYNEFKINKGFWSSQYYLIYFLRRVIYVVCQIYLNQSLYLQGIIQIFCSSFSLAYLFYYKPFKDFSIFVSTIFGEICVFVVFFVSFFLLFDWSNESISILENIIVGSVMVSLSGQFFISLFESFKVFIEAWRKIEKIRANAFLNNVKGCLKENSQAFN